MPPSPSLALRSAKLSPVSPSDAPDDVQAAAWRAVETHAQRLRGEHLREIVARDDGEASLRVGAIYADLRKHKLDAPARAALEHWADARDLRGGIEALRCAWRLNRSEGRPALHPALRALPGQIAFEGRDLGREAIEQRAPMLALADDLRAGRLRGASGEVLDAVLHLGVGGSELGPRLVVEALRDRPGHDAPRIEFLSNIDGEQFRRVTAQLDPARTLVVVASKTFGTLETRANAERVLAWIRDAAPAGLDDAELIAEQFVAATAKPEAARGWGIRADRVLEFDVGVGGRFSLWSTIGFPIAAAVGSEGFEALLAGAREMDAHFFAAPLAENLPVRLALTALWYDAFFEAESRAVVAYDDRLRSLPSHLQQLSMESLGKAPTTPSNVADAPQRTGEIVWGGVGTDAQHAFFQLLHQGSRFVPVEFIVAAHADHGDAEAHEILLASCLAQSRALAEGRRDDQDSVPRDRRFDGDRPSTTLLLDRLDANSLGALLAMYEHQIFAQAWLLGVNAFDQWGVELGKQLAARLRSRLRPPAEDVHPLDEALDPSTASLLAEIRRVREQG